MSRDNGKPGSEQRYSEIGEFIRISKEMLQCLETIRSDGTDDLDNYRDLLWILVCDTLSLVCEGRLQHLAALRAQLFQHCLLLDDVLNLSAADDERQKHYRQLVISILAEWQDFVFDALKAGQDAPEEQTRKALRAILDDDGEIAAHGYLLSFLDEDHKGNLFKTPDRDALAYDLDDVTSRREIHGRLDREWAQLWDAASFADLKGVHREWLLDRLTSKLVSIFKLVVDDVAAMIDAEQQAANRLGEDGRPILPNVDRYESKSYAAELREQIRRRLLEQTAVTSPGRRLQSIVRVPFLSRDAKNQNEWIDGILAYLHELLAALQAAEKQWPDKQGRSPIGEEIYQAFRRYRLRFAPEEFDEVLRHLSRYGPRSTYDLLRAPCSAGIRIKVEKFPYRNGQYEIDADRSAQEAFNLIFPLPDEDKISDQNDYRIVLEGVLADIFKHIERSQSTWNPEGLSHPYLSEDEILTDIREEDLETYVKVRMSWWHTEARRRMALDPELKICSLFFKMAGGLPVSETSQQIAKRERRRGEGDRFFSEQVALSEQGWRDILLEEQRRKELCDTVLGGTSNLSSLTQEEKSELLAEEKKKEKEEEEKREAILREEAIIARMLENKMNRPK